jgi:cysteinyl-tRNA synthetase
LRRSLGNFFTIRDVLARYAPTSLRLMLQGTHYRAAINYTQRALEEASDRAYYIYQTLADIDAVVVSAPPGDASAAAAAPAAKPGKKAPPPGPAEEAASAAAALPAAITAALADDLNTPQALAALSAPLKAANDLLTTKAGRKARALRPRALPHFLLIC